MSLTASAMLMSEILLRPDKRCSAESIFSLRDSNIIPAKLGYSGEPQGHIYGQNEAGRQRFYRYFGRFTQRDSVTGF